MPEVPGRFVDSPTVMAPAVNSYAVLYTVPAATNMIYGVDVCNGGAPRTVPSSPSPGGPDAHISIYIVPSADAWTPAGGEPPVYTRAFYNQRVECDLASGNPDGKSDGNTWPSPVKHLNPGDRVVIFTDTANVTFYGHGFQYT